MKKIQIILTLILAMSFALSVMPSVTLAQAEEEAAEPVVVPPCTDIKGCLTNAAGAQGAGYDTTEDPTRLAKIVGLIVRAFLSLTGIIFVSYIIYGGFLWMTGGGNEERITKAKSIIRNGIIGLIVIFSAAAIYAVVASVYAGAGGGGLGGNAL